MLLAQTANLAPTAEPKAKQWAQFLAWTEETLASPHRPDAVVDGANVACFKGGFDKDAPPRTASVAHALAVYEQVDAVVEALKAKGRRPIVFLHERHFKRPEKGGVAEALQRKWRAASHGLYVVPHGHNDDVFWLYFTLRLGGGAFLVSNDNMRDHRFEMMHSTRAFARWRERHQAKFEIMQLASGWDPRIMLPSAHSICAQRDAQGRWHLPAELPPTDAERAYRDKIERLSGMGLAELSQMYLKGSVPLAEFRDARQSGLGAEIPAYMVKQYQWTCVA